MKNPFLLFTLCFLFAGVLSAQDHNSLLWKIENEAASEPSYLFGTYHLVGAEYLEEHQKVKNAYEGANTVVVEMVVDSSKLMQVAMLGMMPGRSLKNLVDSAEYELIKAEVQRVLDIDIAMLQGMKPMTITTMYAVALAGESTPEELVYGGEAIDSYFATNGKKKGKKVVPLETMMQQAHMLFDSIPVEEQARALVEMVKEKDLGEEMTREILRAYQEEDLEGMWQYAESLGDSYGEMNMLVDSRNKNWVEQLDPLLKDGGVFIAVGALHLPGDKGVIQLLKERGYKLTPVN